MKLSIILPLYNAGKFIAKCIDSILNSDLDSYDYEIIIVNDGSKDNGPEIAQQYAKEYENISYYTQENQGQSIARNLGVIKAKGEYIWFVDSDDTVDCDLKQVVNLLELNKSLEILAFKLRVMSEADELVRTECEQPDVLHNTVIKGRDAIVMGYNPSSVCALMIKRELVTVNKLFFKPGITHQDVELSYKLMAHATDVFFCDFTPYVYILHPNSTSQSINPQKKLKYVSDDIVIIQSFRNLANHFDTNDAELSDVIRNRSNNVLWGMIYSLRQNRKQWRELGIQDELIKRLKDANLYPMRCKFDNWKKQLMAIPLNCEWFIR